MSILAMDLDPGGRWVSTSGASRRYSEIMLRDAKPKLVVLSVGINDAPADSPQLFRAAYLAAMEAIRAPVAFVTITPVNNAALPAGAVSRLNGVIEEIGGASDRRSRGIGCRHDH